MEEKRKLLRHFFYIQMRTQAADLFSVYDIKFKILCDLFMRSRT